MRLKIIWCWQNQIGPLNTGPISVFWLHCSKVQVLKEFLTSIVNVFRMFLGCILPSPKFEEVHRKEKEKGYKLMVLESCLLKNSAFKCSGTEWDFTKHNKVCWECTFLYQVLQTLIAFQVLRSHRHKMGRKMLNRS